MRRLNSFAFATPLLIVTLAVPFLSSRAQSQDDSVAEAARRARQQKKSAAARPSPVITDDTLKRSASSESTDSAPVPTAADKSSTQTASKSGETTGKDDSLKKLKAALEEAKEKLAGAQRALDLSKRELALQQDNVYSKPNYQTDSAGQDKIEELKQQVTERSALVEDFKARVADLQAKLDAQAPGAVAPAAQNPPQP